MNKTIKTYFNWSSGKDASLALYYLQQEPNYEIGKLVTIVNGHYNRVSMHGLRVSLLKQQSIELGIPLDIIKLPEDPTMVMYDDLMKSAIQGYKQEGFQHCAFGDVFLEDLRKYREEQLDTLGITYTFPLWKKDTKTLIKTFIEKGFKAIIICINSSKLDASFVGREIDESFLADLPDDVDPCGEYGEFHTFCYDGPIFKNPIKFEKGEKVFRKYEVKTADDEPKEAQSYGFWFLDLIPIL